jgi:hypothetical protein
MVEVHPPEQDKARFSNNSSDFPSLDPNHGATTVSAARFVAIKVAIANDDVRIAADGKNTRNTWEYNATVNSMNVDEQVALLEHIMWAVTT